MKIKLAFILCGVTLLATGCDAGQSKKQNIQVNNKTCPVSGKCVNDEHTYTHNGKEYKLCSKDCGQELKENPDKYLSD